MYEWEPETYSASTMGDLSRLRSSTQLPTEAAEANISHLSSSSVGLLNRTEVFSSMIQQQLKHLNCFSRKHGLHETQFYIFLDSQANGADSNVKPLAKHFRVLTQLPHMLCLHEGGVIKSLSPSRRAAAAVVFSAMFLAVFDELFNLAVQQ